MATTRCKMSNVDRLYLDACLIVYTLLILMVFAIVDKFKMTGTELLVLAAVATIVSINLTMLVIYNFGNK